MPTVKEYQNDKGYYIRSSINGSYVTLQLSPEAEGLFSDLGLRGEDHISWQFLKPLCDIGHAYTNKSGTEVKTEDIDPEATVSSGKLTLEMKQRLKDFLYQHTPTDCELNEEKLSTSPDEKTAIVGRIDASKRSFIKKWSPSDDEYEATLNRIARADDPDGILKSIAHHSTEHPIIVQRFRVSSQGVPTYSFDTDGIAWTVHDFRTVDKVSTNAELFFEIQPGTSHSQSITMGPDEVEWHTAGDTFSREQIDEFLIVGPDILYYFNHLITRPSASPKKITSNPTANLNPKDESRAESLNDLGGIDPGEYERSLGVVLSLSNKGYGRIRSHSGRAFTYSEDDVEGGGIDVGDIVTFDVKPHRRSIYAHSITKEETEIPSSEILCNWPEWRERSLSWVLDNWEDEGRQQAVGTGSVVIGSSGEETDYECVQVRVDSLAFYLANTDDGTNDAFGEAVRSLLKRTIDGIQSTPQAPIATTEVEISLPTNLLSMIDSVVESSSAYESRSQFFSGALQRHVDEAKQVELTVRVPQGYHDAVERLSEEHGISTPEFMREALEDALISELRHKQ
ncbi:MULTISPECIES: hypothetical protein [unclassified Haloferax]|uniref:hypothetical protein n=1 Tax=unclassified Haloferax TaxID=2625095 RepID=UPI002875ADD0|nr:MULTISPECIES: hypothetical protein [unclassified Haloferax]MDS0243548.1 hypothetical protein [Haloferax sp. S2CR25]MDS0446669.1 hypothetical protein [Haloferax sp. S2CR25-2]